MHTPEIRAKLRGGYSLIEAIIATAILAVALASVVQVSQVSDNLADQAPIDASAYQTFSQNALWLANVPMASFRQSLNSYMASNAIINLGTNGVTINLGTNSGTNVTCGMLQEPSSYYLTQLGSTTGIFPFTMSLTVTSPENSNAFTANYFHVILNLTYSEPSLLVTTVGVTNAPKQMVYNFSKW